MSAAVQRATPSQQQTVLQRPTPTPAVEPQQNRAGDVKLFGQSLLCQPTTSAAAPTGSRLAAVSTNDRVSLQQSVSSTSSAPAMSMAVPSAGLPKLHGKDSVPASSAFRGMLPDGRQASWPTLPGQAGIWSIMNGVQSQANGVYKSSEGGSELHTEEAVSRVSRETRESDSDQQHTMAAHPHKIQHREQARGLQESSRNEGLSNVVHGLDKPRASANDIGGGVGTPVLNSADMIRNDSNRRTDNGSQAMGGTDRGATMMASRNSRGQLESFVMQQAGVNLSNSQQVPRTVINALMAIADWQQRCSLQQPSHPSNNIGSQRVEEMQAWESAIQQGIAAAAAAATSGGAVDSLKVNSSLNLVASLPPAPQSHLPSGSELQQQCVRENSGMYYTPQHFQTLAGHAGVSPGAWNNTGTSLLHHPSEPQRMLVNPAFASFQSRALTAKEEHLGPPDSRDPNNSGSGGVG